MGWIKITNTETGEVEFEAGGQKIHTATPDHYDQRGTKSVPVGPFTHESKLMKDDDYYFEKPKTILRKKK